MRTKIHIFLSEMPCDKWYNIKPEQMPFIIEWMLDREWDGGIVFNKRMNQIMKNEIPKTKN